MKIICQNKEISWLSFNARLLQEAADPSVPLVERLKFLGIFSSNLDEFFRVRVATLKRLVFLGNKALKLIGDDPAVLLKEIHKIVLTQRVEFDHIYDQILDDLKKENIFIVNEQHLDRPQTQFVKNFFRDKVRPLLIPLMIDQMEKMPALKDHSLYLAVRMSHSKNPKKYKYALIELPTDILSRFVVLPKTGDHQFIILLDDVIRYNLHEIFSVFNFNTYEAFAIKLTRDAELDIEDDFSESMLNKINKSLTQRKSGKPVRFIFDHEIPGAFFKYLIKVIHPDKVDSSFIPGGRYHNFKDFINFPPVGSDSLRYASKPPLPHVGLEAHKSILKTLDKQDVLLHYPYQRFDYVIDFLREAAIDPTVISIKITIYRLANRSRIVNALINAAKNGKNVTVMIELKARFDEAANINWSKRLHDEGIKVIYSSKKIKVHAKLILVTCKNKRKLTNYAHIGTGNFNESTARIYTDHGLLTADKRLAAEVAKIFETLENNYSRVGFRHLIVAPFNMRKKWTRLIETEIENAKNGKEAYIIAKLNNLTDTKIIKKLYQASQAGVSIRLMVRGMFSVVPGVKGVSENIEATGTIDKFLEHTRIFAFANGGDEKYFLSSADWMPRNLDKRIEAACPIYDKKIQNELREYLNIHWRDNIKARILNADLDNHYRNGDAGKKVRAQDVLYKYFQRKLIAIASTVKFETPQNGRNVGVKHNAFVTE